jgi:hypothetical protein
MSDAEIFKRLFEDPCHCGKPWSRHDDSEHYFCATGRLSRENEALRSRLDLALEALRAVQWSRWDSRLCNFTCAVCGADRQEGLVRVMGQGDHAPDCLVARALNPDTAEGT